MSTPKEEAAILRVGSDWFGIENAVIECSECDGFRGVECPVARCSVRLRSTQREDDERCMEELRERDKESRQRRQERAARRPV